MKLKFRKKAMTTNFLVALIITLVAFVLIAGTVFRFMSGAEDKEAEILCHDSIALRATSTIRMNSGGDQDWHDIISGQAKVVPVLCKTIDTKVKGSREEIKEIIAEKIARCWWMFGEGRYEEILDGSDVHLAPALLGMSNEENDCFNCYNLMIEVDDIDAGDDGYGPGPIGQEELLNYMWNNDYKEMFKPCKLEKEDCKGCKIDSDCDQGKKAGKCLKDEDCKDDDCQKFCAIRTSLNYFEYIQSYGGPGMFVNLQGEIKGRHAYTISILPKNKDVEQTNWVKWGGYAAAIGGGLLAAGGVIAAVICTAGTLGACTPVALTVASGAVTAGGYIAGAGMTAAGAGLGYELIQGKYADPKDVAPPPGIEKTDAGVQISFENMFKERAYSSVYLGETTYAQQYCVSGDLAGE